MEVEEDATLMSPIPLEGRRMSSEQEQLDISPHEAMLQSQLRSTQQQLEDLQRQYMEVPLVSYWDPIDPPPRCIDLKLQTTNTGNE